MNLEKNDRIKYVILSILYGISIIVIVFFGIKGIIAAFLMWVSVLVQSGQETFLNICLPIFIPFIINRILSYHITNLRIKQAEIEELAQVEKEEAEKQEQAKEEEERKLVDKVRYLPLTDIHPTSYSSLSPSTRAYLLLLEKKVEPVKDFLLL